MHIHTYIYRHSALKEPMLKKMRVSKKADIVTLCSARNGSAILPNKFVIAPPFQYLCDLNEQDR